MESGQGSSAGPLALRPDGLWTASVRPSAFGESSGFGFPAPGCYRHASLRGDAGGIRVAFSAGDA